MGCLSRRLPFIGILCGWLAAGAASQLQAASPGAVEQPGARHRSPVDLVLSPDNRWLVTVNQTAHSASLVSIEAGKVLDEVLVGRHPAGIALHAPSGRVLVTSRDDGMLTILRVENGRRLRRHSAIQLGGNPHGVAVHPEGTLAYVALEGLDQVAIVDLEHETVRSRIDVGRWPRNLAYSPQFHRLAVGTSGDRGVSLVDLEQERTIHIDRFVGLNIGHMVSSRDGRHVYFPWMVYRRQPITSNFVRLGWVMASRVARLRVDVEARREAMSLDPSGRAVADPHGIALTGDEQRLVISSSGTHELLVFRLPDLPLEELGSTDHIPPELLEDEDRFFRIETGGRPLGLRIAPDDRTVYIANYLEDSVQVVDLEQRKLVGSLSLGGPAEESLARRGERIFYDAQRSLDQWYSCHSCHTDGGANAVAMDTNNDGSARTFKTVLPLYHLSRTEPWTWHGWQRDLEDAMHKSVTSTMLGKPPSDEDRRALLAFLDTLAPPANPHRKPDGGLTEAARRGERIFRGKKAACAECHQGPYFTDGQTHDLGLGDERDRYREFNTPSLLGVYRKVALLHDGRCSTLEEVLTGPHAPEKVAGSGMLSEQELADLIAYLKSL